MIALLFKLSDTKQSFISPSFSIPGGGGGGTAVAVILPTSIVFAS
jgi:hypothetical protein